MGSVIITGASMGIGRELALGWARQGRSLVLSARNASALEEVAHDARQAGAADVLTPAGDVTDAAYRKQLIDAGVGLGGIDVLVNNAGRGYYSQFENIDLQGARDLFELNLFAPLELTQLALHSLRNTRGTVVMLSSVAGVVAAPRYAAYAATKFALEGMSMALRAEVAEQGVSVVVIRPGPVDTPFRQNAARGKREEGGYSEPDKNAQSAVDVARRTIDAVAKGRSVDETSAFVRLASGMTRLSPAVMRLVVRRMASKAPPP